jgi:hypothetical protein
MRPILLVLSLLLAMAWVWPAAAQTASSMPSGMQMTLVHCHDQNLPAPTKSDCPQSSHVCCPVFSALPLSITPASVITLAQITVQGDDSLPLRQALTSIFHPPRA